MILAHIQLNIDKRRNTTGLQAALRTPATPDMLDATEQNIGQKFPKQVRAFYSTHNGLTIVDPPFEILPVEKLAVDEQSRIHFATADNTHRICFDCSRLNDAEQWDILDADTGERFTYTMASFWTIRMWKWIDRRVAFWRGEH